MASENLINDLFEIIQANSDEKIYYSDFEKDLLKNINLPNGEIDRALTMIISQAEINPDIVGETKGGTFIVSQSFTKSIVSTIEYEKVLEERRNLDANNIMTNVAVGMMLAEKAEALIDDVIISNDIAEQMINDYGNLNASEVMVLWDSYDDLDEKNQDALREARKNDIKAVIEDPEATEEEKSDAEKDLRAASRSDDEAKASRKGILDPLRRKKYRESIAAYKEKNPEVFSSVFPDVDKIEDLSDEMLILIKDALNRVEDKTRAIGYRQRSFGKDILGKKSQTNGVTLGGESQQSKDDNQRFGETPFSEKMSGTYRDLVVRQGNGGKNKVIIPGTVQEGWYKLFGEVRLEVSYAEKEEDLAYVVAAFDTMYQKINISEKDKLQVMKTLRDVIKEIPQNLLLEESSIKKAIGIGLRMKMGESASVDAVMEMLETFDSLIPAIKDNRDEVISGALNPYIAGKEQGNDITQIMTDCFQTIVHEKLHDIQREYHDYAYNYDQLFVNRETKRQKEIIEGMPGIPHFNVSKLGGQHYGNTAQMTAVKKYITDTEYHSAKIKEETLQVDEDGLRKSSAKALEMDVFFQDTDSSVSYNYENQFDGISPELMGINPVSSRRTKPADKTVQSDDKKEVDEKSSSKLDKESSSTDEVRNGLLEMDPKRFLNPMNMGAKNIKSVKASEVKEQADALREAAKVSEKSLQELIEKEMEEQNKGDDEPTQGE